MQCKQATNTHDEGLRENRDALENVDTEIRETRERLKKMDKAYLTTQVGLNAKMQGDPATGKAART